MKAWELLMGLAALLLALPVAMLLNPFPDLKIDPSIIPPWLVAALIAIILIWFLSEIIYILTGRRIDSV